MITTAFIAKPNLDKTQAATTAVQELARLMNDYASEEGLGEGLDLQGMVKDWVSGNLVVLGFYSGGLIGFVTATVSGNRFKNETVATVDAMYLEPDYREGNTATTMALSALDSFKEKYNVDTLYIQVKEDYVKFFSGVGFELDSVVMKSST